MNEPGWECEQFVLEADIAVSKCFHCLQFGHRGSECPYATERQVMPNDRRSRQPFNDLTGDHRAETSDAIARWWWTVAWIIWGFVAGCASALIWRVGQ